MNVSGLTAGLQAPFLSPLRTGLCAGHLMCFTSTFPTAHSTDQGTEDPKKTLNHIIPMAGAASQTRQSNVSLF